MTPPTLEEDARDIGVVLDAARSQRTCVLSVDPSTTGPTVLFAAENPELKGLEGRWPLYAVSRELES